MFLQRSSFQAATAALLLIGVVASNRIAEAQNIISFNHATSSGTALAPSDPMGAAETAGASGYNDDNWNNLLSDWSGNSGAVPSPILYNDGTTVTGLTIAYDAPNAWSNGIGTSTGDLKMMKNYLDSGASDSPYVEFSGVPYRKFDVVLYADGDGTTNVDGPYVLRYGTGTRQQAAQTELGTNVTNLLRPVVWIKESGNFSGTYTQVSTTASLSVAGAAAGNYMVFPGVKGNFTIDPTQTSGAGTVRAPLNGYQLVQWQTTNVMPGADDATAKLALYSGNTTLTANRTIGSIATSVGTFGDFFINAGITLTLANGDLDIGDINHWIQGGGSITSSTNTLTINRDISSGLSYTGGTFGATDAAINGVTLVDNGGNALNVVKTGGGNLRISTQPGPGTQIAQPYTGTTTISQGSIEIGHAQALGNATSTVQINDATTSFFNTALYLDDGITLARNINVANLGNGSTALGTLLGSGTHTFAGNIALNKSATISVPTGGTVNFSTGAISGVGGITKTGGGTSTLTGANSFSGNVTVTGGTLIAGSGFSGTNTNLGTRTGSRTITVGSGATLRLSINDVFGNTGLTGANTPAIVVNGGTLDSTRFNAVGNVTLNGATMSQNSSDTGTYQGYQFVGTVTVGGTTASTISSSNGKGNHLLGGGTTTFDVADATSSTAVDLTVSNPILDGSGNYSGIGSLIKAGVGTMLVSGSNSYTGTSTVNAGTLLVNGTHTGGGLYTVGDGSGTDTLGGSGTINANVNILSGGGVLAPGTSPGILTINGNVSIAGSLSSELAGVAVGTNYDQLRLGTSGGPFNVTLGGTLTPLFSGSGWATPTTMLWIVNNQSVGTLSGVFSNYPMNGQLVTTYDSQSWRIWYNANLAAGTISGGNDIVLTPIPEPGTLSLLLFGTLAMAILPSARRRYRRLPA